MTCVCCLVCVLAAQAVAFLNVQTVLEWYPSGPSRDAAAVCLTPPPPSRRTLAAHTDTPRPRAHATAPTTPRLSRGFSPHPPPPPRAASHPNSLPLWRLACFPPQARGREHSTGDSRASPCRTRAQQWRAHIRTNRCRARSVLAPWEHRSRLLSSSAAAAFGTSLSSRARSCAWARSVSVRARSPRPASSCLLLSSIQSSTSASASTAPPDKAAGLTASESRHRNIGVTRLRRATRRNCFEELTLPLPAPPRAPASRPNLR